ncbi:efflux RND transporter periplasmic adaptor subunit [Cohnella soli]|uniref:Efflux RND transporter periplasmic adaptor subunit n=1 Tax=Cohnella soli TaxID=425005 RepID=A0ABW0HV07_9BACL
MCIEWPMAESFRRTNKKLALLLLAAACLNVATGCSLLPREEAAEEPPAIRAPKISQKPEYPVKRSTLELKASGSGKLMSEKERNLFVTKDGRRYVDVRAKAGDKVKKGQVLALLDTGDTEKQILRKEIELEKAELDLKSAMRADNEEGEILLRKQQLDYRLLKEELAELRTELQEGKLVAPFDGTIVSFSPEVGDVSKAFEKIGRIADMGALVVAVQFGNSDLEAIAPGMKAIVGVNAAGDHEGTVRRLPVTSEGLAEDSLDSYALIDLKDMPAGSQHGTPLSASVIVERRENVLSIPVAALRKMNSRYYVVVKNADGSMGEVDVEIGVRTTTDVEIIKGLAEGQKVVGK